MCNFVEAINNVTWWGLFVTCLLGWTVVVPMAVALFSRK